MSKAYVSKVKTYEDQKQAIQSGLEWIEWYKLIAPNARVFIKPNLTTYPIFTPGVTTSPEFIDAVLEILTRRTRNITIGESDGGRHAWTADDAFRGHNLKEITSRHKVQLVNLSHEPWETAHAKVGNKTVHVQLPSLLLHKFDVFITLPIPKLHCMTYLSMAFKNQWGCLPDVMRYRNHYNIDQMLVALAKILPTKIAIYDGKYFLDNNGPLMGGIPIEKNLVIVSDDFGAGDLVCCEIMGVPWQRVRHYRVANRENMFPNNLSEVKCNTDITAFKDRTFRLRMTFWNRVALIAFHSRFITWLVYDSPFDKPLHWFLYLFRKNPIKVFQEQKEEMFVRKTPFNYSMNSKKK